MENPLCATNRERTLWGWGSPDSPHNPQQDSSLGEDSVSIWKRLPFSPKPEKPFGRKLILLTSLLFLFLVNDNLLCNWAMLQGALLRGIQEARIVYIATRDYKVLLTNNGIRNSYFTSLWKMCQTPWISEIFFLLDWALLYNNWSTFPCLSVCQRSQWAVAAEWEHNLKWNTKNEFTSRLKRKLRWTPSPLPEIYIKSMKEN